MYDFKPQATEPDRICRDYELSIADFNWMGALRIDRPESLRATDLAVTLQVSNAALTSRINRLAHKGILIKSPAPDDHRAFRLCLTPAGVTTVDKIHIAIERESQFVRHFRQLSEGDGSTLERIMGELHTLLDRDFVHIRR